MSDAVEVEITADGEAAPSYPPAETDSALNDAAAAAVRTPVSEDGTLAQARRRHVTPADTTAEATVIAWSIPVLSISALSSKSKCVYQSHPLESRKAAHLKTPKNNFLESEIQ